ncbi:TVP38/TMEM64 family protein [Rhodopila globiformis]|uniref:TVP38/TMEM64 family protein n=1 Tax=Rhodopila globiformis TaxID=1071 RepID=UPI0019599F89|nr:VTT domain-containing protein [Rhodopila globiformis]
MSTLSPWITRIAVLAVIAGLIAAFFALGLQHVLSLDALRSNEHDLLAFRNRQPVVAAAAYVLLYMAVVTLAVPGAVVMTLAGGAIFGLPEGTVLASFASSFGAAAAFLASRFLFRDWVKRRFQSRLEQVNRGLEKDGWVYLLSLRLVPVIPYTLINLVFGVTAIPLALFYGVSQIGMLPATIVYVNAGTRLEHVRSASDILSPVMIGSLLLLAILPLAARAVTRRLMRHG